MKVTLNGNELELTDSQVKDIVSKYKKEEKSTGFAIKSRWFDTQIVFQSTKTNLSDAVLEAVERGANLRGANLRGANLRGANLQDANLQDANLQDANLQDANTKYTKVNFSPSEYVQAKQFIEGLK
jgi:hypothetical protein